VRQTDARDQYTFRVAYDSRMIHYRNSVVLRWRTVECWHGGVCVTVCSIVRLALCGSLFKSKHRPDYRACEIL